MLGLIIGAGILGIIIAAMEGGDFPGWGKMVVCVLAAVVPAAVIDYAAPDLFPLGLVVGAACGGLAIMGTTGMGTKRAAIAVGIWLAVQLVLSIALQAMFRA
jgi:hypothetical protein